MNLKKTLLTASLFLFTTIGFAQERIVGNDVDAHGCRPSAGYTWSAIKKECIRLFEEPVQLKEVKPKGTYTSGCTLIFSPDNKKVEVFIPTEKNGIILLRSGKAGNYMWKKGTLVLTEKGGYKLKRGKTLIFAGENPQPR